MARQLSIVDGLGPQIGRLLQRFPWAVLAAVSFAAYFLLGLQHTVATSQETIHLRLLRIPCGLTLAFLWSVVVALHAEARGFGAGLRHAATLAGFAVIALLVVFAIRLDALIGLPIGALMLAVGLAPYGGGRYGQAAYWRFNHDVWVGYLAAVIATLLFGAGLSAIIETLRYLFGFAITFSVHEKIWAVACGLVGPLYWASVIPEDFADPIPEGPPTEFTSRMVALLVKFILVPLLLVYGAILHVYAAKILADGALPKGRLGWLVLLFGAMTVLTVLLAYPTRQSSGALVSVFWRFWPVILAAPLVMLFLAVAVRINAYGVTESRYWVVAVGLWLAAIALAHGLGWRDLRLIPAGLAAITLVASLGPWGMSGWALRSQVAQFAGALDKAGLLKDGRVTPDPQAKPKPGSPEAYRLSNLVAFFSTRQQLARLQPFFAGDANDPFTKAAATEAPRTYYVDRSDWQMAERIRTRLGVAGASWGTQSPNVFNVYVSPLWVVPLPEGGWLVSGGHVTRTQGRGGAVGTRPIAVGPLQLMVRLEDAQLVVESTGEGGARAVFDLAPLEAADSAWRTESDPTKRKPISLQPKEGTLPITLIVTQMAATLGGNPPLAVNSLGYALIVRDKR